MNNLEITKRNAAVADKIFNWKFISRFCFLHTKIGKDEFYLLDKDKLAEAFPNGVQGIYIAMHRLGWQYDNYSSYTISYRISGGKITDVWLVNKN